MQSKGLGFEELGVAPHFVEVLSSQHIVSPTSIQSLAIPRILDGESIVVKSQTGSGKSLAYLLPIVQMAAESGRRVLVLLPTRELAQQVARVAMSLGSDVGVATIYGGVEYDVQREALAAAPQIVVATPGRLEDLMEQGVAHISDVGVFVLDEVDQMVDLGFRDAIERLSGVRSVDAQSICVSATLADGVREVVDGVVGAVVEIVEDSAAPLAAQQIAQCAYFVEQSMMDHLLLHLLRTKRPAQTIIFCRSRKMADRLAELLRANDFAAEAIHSDRSQAAREYILQRFRDAETQYLVATDLMARGIDVAGVSHVFNFGLPQSTHQYVHRVGRTGRAGASGEAVTLLCPDEKGVLSATCATMRQNIEVVDSHPYLTPAVTLALNGVERPKAKGKRSRRCHR
ncbi:MAG: DEAD/DEAH box helicase [Rikenellaceae bacterium]